MLVHIGRPLLSVISAASLRSKSFSSRDHVCILPFTFRNKPPSDLDNGSLGESSAASCRSARKADDVRFACARTLLFAGRLDCVSERWARLGCELHLLTSLSNLLRLLRRRRDLERNRTALEEQAIQLLNCTLRVVFPNKRDVAEPIACRLEVRSLAQHDRLLDLPHHLKRGLQRRVWPGRQKVPDANEMMPERQPRAGRLAEATLFYRRGTD